MVQRTVLKVDISCKKCKKKILKAISALEGVDKIEVDEGKGTVAVTGNADPYEVIVRTRKAAAGKHAEVVSIGPPPPPPKPDAQKKPDEKKPPDNKKPDDKKQQDNKKPDQKPLLQFQDYYDPPPYPPQYSQRVVYVYDSYNQPNQSCFIM